VLGVASRPRLQPGRQVFDADRGENLAGRRRGAEANCAAALTPVNHLRWPSGKPRLNAFWRSAPGVRFMALAIFLTGDLLRECAFSSRKSAFDQERLLGLPRLLTIIHLALSERLRPVL
jgi:hypothetical protein